jgi:hypothetical protein
MKRRVCYKETPRQTLNSYPILIHVTHHLQEHALHYYYFKSMHCTNTARALHYSPGQPCFVTQKEGYESTMSTPASASCSWGYV